ncbi:MAG: signal recognition particle protein [Candidatus Babeliales bacterium]|jgi:signal recognition particle subunit SRP54
MFDFLAQKFSGILSRLNNKGKLTEDNIKEALATIRTALLDADVPLNIVESFLAEVSNEATGATVGTALNPGQQFTALVYRKLVSFLGGTSTLLPTFQIPSVIMVMGLQGSGKTTTIAKLADYLVKQATQRGKKRHILLASVDFYRPAAIDQLEILAHKIGVSFYRATSTSTLTAADEIYDYFTKSHFDYLFLDTAGRLHVDQGMMDELRTITTRLNPKHKLLILDAMTGQESLNVATAFDATIGFEAALLTKMDSETRGGAAFAFRYALKKPIAWVGTGEKIEDLEAFIPDRIATRILGMGDIQTLVEKAQQTFDQSSQEATTRRLMEGNFTLKDFYDQLGMIDKLGSFEKISKYLPGAQNVSPEMMEQGKKEAIQFKAIISAMTPKERILPQILDASRKKRIALGSGVSVQEVNLLLQRFEQSRQFAKMFRRFGKIKH